MVHGIFNHTWKLTILAWLVCVLGCGGAGDNAEPAAEETPAEVPAAHPELNQPTTSPQEMGDPGKDGTKPPENAEIPGPAEQTPLTVPPPE